MASDETDYLRQLTDNIRAVEKKGMRLTISCSLMCTLLAYDARNAKYILATNLHKDALNFIKSAGPDPTKWGGNNSAEGWSVYVIMLLSSTPKMSAKYLREADASTILGPLMSYDHLIGMMAAISVAFMTDQEGSSSFNELLESNPAVIERVIDLFDDALHNRKGKGYSKRTFMLSIIVHAVRCLVVNGIHAELLGLSRLLQLFNIILNSFISTRLMGNEATEEGCVTSVRLALESLHHIAYVDLSNSEAPLPISASTSASASATASASTPTAFSSSFSSAQDSEAARASHAAAIKVHLRGISGQLLLSLRSLKSCRRYAALGDEAHAHVETLLSILPTERSLTRHDAIYNISDAIADPNGGSGSEDPKKQPKHIVVSRFRMEIGDMLTSTEENDYLEAEKSMRLVQYSKLENSLIGKLKEMGYDVWTSETGSSLQPLGSVKNRDPALEAIDRSCVVIVCLSAEYLKDVSFSMEVVFSDVRRKECTYNLLPFILGF
jgi:hypothetical protein